MIYVMGKPVVYADRSERNFAGVSKWDAELKLMRDLQRHRVLAFPFHEGLYRTLRRFRTKDICVSKVGDEISVKRA